MKRRVTEENALLRGLSVAALLAACTAAGCAKHSMADLQAMDAKNQNAAGQPAGGTACTTDNDCKGDRICEAGACVNPPLDELILVDLSAGSVALPVVEAVLASRQCYELPGLAGKMTELSGRGEERAQAVSTFAVELAAGDSRFDDGAAAYGEWVLRIRDHAELCGRKLDNAEIANITKGIQARVSEAEVEKAMASHDCGKLTAVDAGKLWPFKHRFAQEVYTRQFGEAEVTRRLWIKMLGQYKTECIKRLSERQKIAVDAQVDKLERIVGLDDSMLIDLRNKLLDAIEKNDANSVLSYSRAVTEREAQLDQRNAAAYKAKLATMQAELKAQKAELASVQAAGQVAVNNVQAAPAKAGTGQGSQVTLKDINDAANTTVKTVEAVQTVGSLFGF